MSHRLGPFIREGKYSELLSIGGYVFFALVLVASLDSGAIVLAVASGGVLLLQLVGERLYAYSGAGGSTGNQVARSRIESSLTWTILVLGAFAALDILNVNTQSLPGLGLSSFGGNFTQALTLLGLFTVQIAIAESIFFQGGIANLGAKVAGAVGAIVLSFAAAFAFHVFVYPVITAAIVGTDFAFLTYAGLRTGRLLPVMLGHLINNLFFVVLASVIGLHALGWAA